MTILLIISLLINILVIWRFVKAFRAFKTIQQMEGKLQDLIDGLPKITPQEELKQIESEHEPKITSISFKPFDTPRVHTGPTSVIQSNVEFQGYEVLGKLFLIDNEYLPIEFQDIGHHGEFVVIGETQNHFLILHNRLPDKEMFVNKLAVHKFMPVEKS